MNNAYQIIRESFGKIREETKARHRDIAEMLDISEGELIAAHIGRSIWDDQSPLQATRLRAEWPALMRALESLGEVMALTRNASCVHEKIGVYRNFQDEGHAAMVLNGDIDLRISFRYWAWGFAVVENTARSVQKSLQFFDAHGTAVHKVFMKPQSDQAAYERLVAKFKSNDQSVGASAATREAAPPELSDLAIDVPRLRNEWSAMRDTHDFFGMLRRCSVSRLQALRLVGPDFARESDRNVVRATLLAATESKTPIKVFVGNPGMIQIHSGTVERFSARGAWINILDPRFSLHLREDRIGSAWLVRKPTDDGIVTSLEIFNAEGENIALFFGEHKHGKPELASWRSLIEGLAIGTSQRA